MGGISNWHTSGLASTFGLKLKPGLLVVHVSGTLFCSCSPWGQVTCYFGLVDLPLTPLQAS